MNHGISSAIWGNYAIVGATGKNNEKGNNMGAAYLFEQKEGVWTEIKKFSTDDGNTLHRFGTAVGFANEVALVGTPYDDENGSNAGAAYVFEKSEAGKWQKAAKLMASDGAENDYNRQQRE